MLPASCGFLNFEIKNITTPAAKSAIMILLNPLPIPPIPPENIDIKPAPTAKPANGPNHLLPAGLFTGVVCAPCEFWAFCSLRGC